MPTSPLKRPSAAGRLGRLLASLRPPARAGPLPVQTGFPTSLADLVVKNHVRLKKPRRRHRASAASPSHAPSVEPEPPAPQQRREVLSVRDAAAAVGPNKGAAFSVRPELLAVGGAVALALLVVWSRWLVAAATAASVALFWVDSVRSPASPRRRRPRQETEACPAVPCGRGRVSLIREAEPELAGTPRSSCADSDSDRGSEVSSLIFCTTTDTADPGCRGGGGEDEDSSIAPESKEKRRSSLRKLIAKKLRNNGKRRPKADTDTDAGFTGSLSLHGGESESTHPDAGEAAAVNTRPVELETTEPHSSPSPAVETTTKAPPADANAVVEGRSNAGAGAFPWAAAIVPVILAGLVAGKLQAVALTVLCAAFFRTVDNGAALARLP